MENEDFKPQQLIEDESVFIPDSITKEEEPIITE